uniref:uncharacterized protein LOC120340793 n=1 Tax=Styela clava TaxID=7725 RepID=UPI001939D803|nr:uncharacterized protein LOC120340793 [Styela clava]
MCWYICIVLNLIAFIGLGQARFLPDFFYWPGVCPPHAPRTNCYPNPCLVHRCPLRPDAICEPNYCGGCRPDFFDESGRKIPLEKCFDFSCKHQIPSAICPELIKKDFRCEQHPDAIFIEPMECSSCGIFFKFGRRLLTHECRKRDVDGCG